MSDDEVSTALPALPPLGPGDDDPASKQAVAGEATKPLGPGDDDPRSPAKGVALAASTPPGPGDTVGDEPDGDLVMLAPAPAGPGDAASGPRHLGVVRRRAATVVPIPVAEDAPVESISVDHKE